MLGASRKLESDQRDRRQNRRRGKSIPDFGPVPDGMEGPEPAAGRDRSRRCGSFQNTWRSVRWALEAGALRMRGTCYRDDAHAQCKSMTLIRAPPIGLRSMVSRPP